MEARRLLVTMNLLLPIKKSALASLLALLAGITGATGCEASNQWGDLPTLTSSRSKAASAVPKQQFAERLDQKDRIIYQTDPELERESEDRKMEEKQKEERAWRMLENTYIEEKREKRRHPRRNPDEPQP